MKLQRRTPEAWASGVLVTKLWSPAKQFGDAPVVTWPDPSTCKANPR